MRWIASVVSWFIVGVTGGVAAAGTLLTAVSVAPEAWLPWSILVALVGVVPCFILVLRFVKRATRGGMLVSFCIGFGVGSAFAAGNWLLSGEATGYWVRFVPIVVTADTLFAILLISRSAEAPPRGEASVTDNFGC